VESLDTGGSWVEHDHVETSVVHDAQNVRMSADEDVRAIALNELEGTPIIVTGETADMSHQNVLSLPFEILVNGIIVNQTSLVAIADNAYKRLELGNFVCCGKSATEIAGMPQFIAGREKVLELMAEGAMRV